MNKTNTFYFKGLLRVVVVLFSFCTIAVSVAFGENKQATSALALKDDFEVSSQTITTIPSGGSVYVIDSFSNGWSLVIYKSHTGYVRTSDLKPLYSLKDNNHSNYYYNSYGQRVQSPTHSSTAPKGATARCVDGTYSFSQNRRGTCSHHGGVAQWL